MSASTIINGILSSSAAVTGVVGTRIYPQQMPQTAQFPALTFTTISTVPNNTKSGVSSMDRLRIQVTMVANLQSTIDDLGSKVRTALDYYVSAPVQLISFQSENDTFDEGSGQDGIFIKFQDYFLTISK
jgi:hypothetical protein